MIECYTYQDFYFFWKPHGIPSTFGKQKSFLNYLEERVPPQRRGFGGVYPDFIQNYLKIYQKIQSPEKTIESLKNTFGKEKEYGLLNRLDNETAGLLYFAKDLSTYDNYRQVQVQDKIEKHYIAQVEGKIDQSMIEYPIMHRSSLRMIAIKSPNDIKKGSGKEHHVKTYIEILKYDKKTNISTLKVTIHKGIRHQIRVHLASIGFPIIGDALYGTPSDYLHLWSVGCASNE